MACDSEASGSAPPSPLLKVTRRLYLTISMRRVLFKGGLLFSVAKEAGRAL
jgi:hypothetical protein